MMDSIHVATFNVNCHFQRPACHQVADCIVNCGAEVVCLQESNEHWESFLSSHPDIPSLYPYIEFHNHRNIWGGFAILSKFPLDSIRVLKETHRYWYPAGIVTIRVPSTLSNTTTKKRLVQLLIVHLRAPVIVSPEKPFWWGGHANWIGGYFSKQVQKERMNEIVTFISALQPDIPTIILGDFNERRTTSPCLQYLTNLGYVNTSKSSMDGRFSCCPCRRKNTWSFEHGGIPLLGFDYDHIVYSKTHLEPIDGVAYIHKDGGSDHRLVSAHFQFKGS